MSNIGYVAYLDEAGDFGLGKISPIDANGASEWFIMAGAVVRKDKEALVPQWLSAIREEARNTQSMDLHFRTLSDGQKRMICGRVAGLDLRLFVVISNKRNMRQHDNKSAKNISRHKHWFYWWITRLLLERITAFCAARNALESSHGRTLQIEFSARKDLKRQEFTDYFTRLYLQGSGVFLDKRVIDWDVFSFDDVHFYDHQTRAGLQFADVVASAFYQAVSTHSRAHCTDYAKMLAPRMHRKVNESCLGEGFTVWPKQLRHITLQESQKDLFRFYGMSGGDLPR